MRNVVTAAVCLQLSLLATGTRGEAPTYLNDVQPVFQKYCIGCHNDQDHEGDVSLESFASLQQGSPKGPVLLAGEPDSSRLIRLMTGTAEPVMPPEGEKRPTDAEIALVRNWIEAGAVGPKGVMPDRLHLVVPEVASHTDIRPISAVALSPNGDALAVARYAEVTLYRKSPGKGQQEWGEVQKLTEFPGKVTAVHFTAGGERLLTASGVTGRGAVATIWEWSLGQKVREFKGHRDIIYDAELSPDGRTLATCSYDQQIILWNAETGEILRELSGHNGPVYDVAFSPDGQYLVSASADDTCKVWRVENGERLDTLGQPLKEEYCVRFSPDGKWIVASGADRTLRVWKFVSRDNPRINPMQFARFAHEGAVVNMEFTRDGSRLITVAEDRTIKVWETEQFTELQLWEKEPEVVSSLAIDPSGRRFIVGRLDGSLSWESLSELQHRSTGGGQQLASIAVSATEMATVTEQEPNSQLAQAQTVRAPATIKGTIDGVVDGQPDVDIFRFSAHAGEEWMIEVNAARSKSPLDSFVEVLHADGSRIERLQLQAVRESYFTFRGKDGKQSGDFRLFAWEEMELNQYLYANGEVNRLWLYPRGPDSGFNVYPGQGDRWAYFDTNSVSHALGEPAYVVEPHAPDEQLIPNGLPVFRLYYENDDECRHSLGKDSRVFFTAPESGEYLVKIKDVRGFQGTGYTYSLSIRPRQPDFKVTLHNTNPKVPAGSAKEFKVTVERLDEYDGPIRVDISGELPEGFTVTTPIVLEAGHETAYGVLSARADAPQPAAEAGKQIQVTATAEIRGEQVTHPVNNLGTIELAPAPKVVAQIRPLEGDMPAEGPLEVTLKPGETIRLKVRVDRHDFDGEVKFGNEFSGRNLPHGTFVDNIGLNGLMLLSGQNEREFFITAAPWVPAQSRLFHLNADTEGGQASNPVLIHIER
ncbi:MAG: PD40 domain-containing protein [Planctomycetaceae bacterium]|nr:PD40 domain-containing protein [Planctomycetaceae bacterium]